MLVYQRVAIFAWGGFGVPCHQGNGGQIQLGKVQVKQTPVAI